MFSKDDYLAYFDQLEGIFKRSLVTYTDLLNELDNKSIRSKLLAITSESMEEFKTIVKIKKKIV